MKEYNLKIYEEEMETLKEGNGKKVCILEDEDMDIKVNISFSSCEVCS